MIKTTIFQRFGATLALGITFCSADSLWANTFNYTNGNVLVCFRQADVTQGGLSLGGDDLVVNAGPISYFTNLAPNQKVTITAYTGSQLATLKTNNMGWSAWAYYDSTAPGGYASTIYMTSPRPDLTTQSSPYYRDRASAQNLVISKLAVIVAGAQANTNYSVNNTPTAVLESDSYSSGVSSVSYYKGLGSFLNFQNTFQGEPDQYTPANFTTGGTAVRADFYALAPDVTSLKPDGAYLGYFELAPNGVMTYTAYPSATVAVPIILSFNHSGTTNKVQFTTGTSGTYTLRGTNSSGLSAARTTWPGYSSVSGDGNNHWLTNVVTAPNMFYTITAQ